MKHSSILIATVLALTMSTLAAPPTGWEVKDWIIKDEINEIADGSLDLCNVFYRESNGTLYLKVTTRLPIESHSTLNVRLEDAKGITRDLTSRESDPRATWKQYRGVWEVDYRSPADWTGLDRIDLSLLDSRTNRPVDSRSLRMSQRPSLDDSVGNCAFVHHGNQGLTYTDVFRGTEGSPDNGFDEVLELHQARSAPGNFHLSGTLITAADWYDRPFLDWMNTGIAEGWIAIVTSAYAQHIMPFVWDDMNNWAVNIEQDLIQYKFGYNSRVAWIPERVWVSQGLYPDAGVNDPWLGDNWTTHGVDAVILDDGPHCSGHSNEKIHWMDNGSGINLRVIPIHGEFTGNCHGNPGGAITNINNTNLWEICVYGTDWEAAAEMADFSEPYWFDNYATVVNWAADNYPGVDIWKLDNALDNPNFNGDTFDLGRGTYGLIGGADGYGGSNNSWYTDWATTASHSDFHTPTAWDYGTVWTQTYNRVVAPSPANNLSETAWYVMMTNLHETGWHDAMGQPISGWQHRYSSHIKNAAVYAEAANWANGDYLVDVNAYFSDIDLDGVDELILHNDRVMAVFESIGGRAQYIFCKGPGSEIFSIVGSCNTYWAETDGDYDEENSKNHQAAFAEVGPHYRHDLYSMSVVGVTGTTASIELSHNEVTKVISIELGNPYLTAEYDASGIDAWIRHGMSPDLLSMIWDADMERIWDPDVDYMGFRNPNTGATGALVINNGGTNHQLEFSGTLLRGDELHGFDRFRYLLYAGPTSAPDGSGRVAELESLTSLDLDTFSPRVSSTAAFINANTVELFFSEAVDQTTAENTANYSLQNFTGTYTVTSATRQADWSRVRLTLTPNLPGGESGDIVVSNVEDLVGNVIDPAYDTATLAAPSGLTPHTIIIDIHGVIDFDRDNECLYADGDTLTITWDADRLYIGYWNMNMFGGGDFFVNIDTDQIPGSGAPSGSWSRADFADPYQIEYQIAIEQGPNEIQLNYWYWNGQDSVWGYQQGGEHGVSSYIGWESNEYTEIGIPWDEIGNPTALALSMHRTQEDTEISVATYPQTNPTGDHVTMSAFYRIYPPYASGPMPLMGVRTADILYFDLVAPQLVIEVAECAPPCAPTLRWTEVLGATHYEIFRATSPDGPFTFIDETTATDWTETLPLTLETAFYEVHAVGGI